MPRVPIGRAKRLAIDRVITALRDNLDTELAAAITASDVPTIHSPAPSDDAVFRVRTINIEDVVRNHHVVALVYPAGPHRFTTQQSGGLNSYKATAELDVDVFLVFDYALQADDLTDGDGRTLTPEQEMVMRSDLYTEAKRFLVASEGNYGTDAVDAILQDGATDIVYQEIVEGDLTPVREVIEIARTRGVHSGTKHRTVGDRCDVNLTGGLTPWQSGASGEEAPYYSPILAAAGLEVDVSDGASATYTPVTAQQDAASIYMFERELGSDDWRLTYTTGVRGTLTLNFSLNSEPTWVFEGTGLYEGMRSDGAAFFNATSGAIALLNDGSSAVTARTTGSEVISDLNPFICSGMVVTVNGTTWCVSDLELALNWSVAIKRCVTGSENASKVYLTRGTSGARIGGSFTLIDGATAHDAMIDDFVASTERELVITCYEDGDSSSGQARMTLTASQMQLLAPSVGDEGGIRTHSVPFALNGDFSALTDGADFSMVYDEVP